jgi:hypothetical protein
LALVEKYQPLPVSREGLFFVFGSGMTGCLKNIGADSAILGKIDLTTRHGWSKIAA